MQGRGDLGLHLYIPRGKGRSPSAETRISEMESIFIPKPSAVMAVPFAGIFPVMTKQFLHETVWSYFQILQAV